MAILRAHLALLALFVALVQASAMVPETREEMRAYLRERRTRRGLLRRRPTVSQSPAGFVSLVTYTFTLCPTPVDPSTQVYQSSSVFPGVGNPTDVHLQCIYQVGTALQTCLYLRDGTGRTSNNGNLCATNAIEVTNGSACHTTCPATLIDGTSPLSNNADLANTVYLQATAAPQTQCAYNNGGRRATFCNYDTQSGNLIVDPNNTGCRLSSPATPSADQCVDPRGVAAR